MSKKLVKRAFELLQDDINSEDTKSSKKKKNAVKIKRRKKQQPVGIKENKVDRTEENLKIFLKLNSTLKPRDTAAQKILDFRLKELKKQEIEQKEVKEPAPVSVLFPELNKKKKKRRKRKSIYRSFNSVLNLPRQKDPIENRHSRRLFQGDIYLRNGTLRRFATKHEWLRWPNAVVPYTLDQIYSESEKQLIRSAMDEFEKQTCIKWIEQTNEDNYVEIYSEMGCYSDLKRGYYLSFDPTALKKL
ncbi:metalloendopeptidase [Trichonephila inaurata madagascariensis]|uniref:Metalloendopeptidase n=1 Tax=Trichonephila inaurata madagascariensis TaxID=2747483 RepID=A0A8X7C1D3_9ARAC|nr:metalloendopeptidase [Trichonephila inaurata madagascariensis]